MERERLLSSDSGRENSKVVSDEDLPETPGKVEGYGVALEPGSCWGCCGRLLQNSGRGRVILLWLTLAALVLILVTVAFLVLTSHPDYRTVTGRLPHEDLCNASLPLPAVPQRRTWQLDAGMRQSCWQKRHPGEVFEGQSSRNWCWITYKEKCHANLKAHWTWAITQDNAAGEGIVPARAVLPFDPLDQPKICDQPYFGATTGWTPVQQSAAAAWFQKNVKVYVLNLPSDVGRWNTISARLNQLRIPPTRVLGVDMRVPNALHDAKAKGWVPQSYDFDKAQSTAYQPDQKLGSIKGTLGCASAHFKLQEQVMQDGSPLAVAFEDDSWPEDDFVERLWSLVTGELPGDWEVVTLMSRCPYGRCVSKHLTRVQPDSNEPHWRCHAGVNWGMHGVLYRVAALPDLQRRWKPVVFDAGRPHCLDVDVALASISDQVGYYAVPATQDPGFLREMDEGSARYSINVDTVTTAPPPTTTTTSTTLTSSTSTSSSSTSSTSSTGSSTTTTTLTTTSTSTLSTTTTSTTSGSTTTTSTSSTVSTTTTTVLTTTTSPWWTPAATSPPASASPWWSSGPAGAPAPRAAPGPPPARLLVA